MSEPHDFSYNLNLELRRGLEVRGSEINFARAISIKVLNAKMAKLSYIHQINQENKLHLLEGSKVILNAFLKD